MDTIQRSARVTRIHHALYARLGHHTNTLDLSFLEHTEGDEPAVYVFLTNSGIDAELYKNSPGHRQIQNSLDKDRLEVLDVLMDAPGLVLVFGDPRLEGERYYKFVDYLNDENSSGLSDPPWVFMDSSRRWRAEQAEAWMYSHYLRRIGNAIARLLMVSSRTQPPYHRVSSPEDLATPLRSPHSVQVIDVPKRSQSLRPVHPKWSGGLLWWPRQVARVVYKVSRREIVVYGVNCGHNRDGGPNPRNTLRDLWAIENCADILLGFHNGQSLSTYWNYLAATQRGVRSVLVTFRDPEDPASRCVI